MYDIPHRISILMGVKLRVRLFPKKLYLVIKKSWYICEMGLSFECSVELCISISETTLILVRPGTHSNQVYQCPAECVYYAHGNDCLSPLL